jgi:predicted acylesterase/phospholipase RssA
MPSTDAGASAFETVFREELVAIRTARSALSGNQEPAPRGDLVGVALSGGGIRSATFSLGVLQALAKADKLTSVDYLSTVSGGGYIGSFLSAWIHRVGLRKVAEQLKPRTNTANGSSEAPEVTWLRKYSNYLSPKIGALSTDSLTLVTTWLRNVFLNLIILVSLMALIFLVPRLLTGPVHWALEKHADEFGYAAVWIGFFLFPAAVSFNLGAAATKRPMGDSNWVTTTPGVLTTVVLPGVLATVFASLSLFSEHSTMNAHLVGLAAGAGCLLAVAGLFWLAYERLLVGRPFWSVVAPEGLIFVLAYSVSLGVAYLLASMFVSVIHPAGGTTTEKAANAMTFGPPALLIAFGVVGSLIVGLVGRVYFERSREWWSRMNALFVTVGLAWVTVMLLAFYVTPLLSWAHAMTGTWLKAIAGAGWLGSLLAALLVPKPGATKTIASQLLSRALDVAAALVMAGVFVGAAGLTAVAVLSQVPDTTAKATATVTSTDIHLKLSTKASTKQSSVELVEIADSSLLDHVRASFEREHALANHFLPPLKIFGESISVPATLTCVVGCLLVFLLFGWRVDVNKFSLHNMYKNRLIRCYLGASNTNRSAQPFTGFDEDDDIELDKLRSQPDPAGTGRPLHIVNAALNLTHGSNLAWQERKAASFTFTPWTCGYSLSASVGDSSDRSARTTGAVGISDAYRDTQDYAAEHDEDRHFSLGMAMATSGAAVSPNMGRASSRPLAFLLTLFNVRLGRWSPNPAREKWKSASPTYGLVCLLQELFGFSNESRTFVYLSDGGHFDNTGIYELVRRGCRTILAVDAGADEERSFKDIANAIRKCRVDFGVEISLPIQQLGTSRAEESDSSGYAIGDILYRGGRFGKLVVIKPTLLGLSKLPADLFAYGRADPAFPQQPTADQFFDESQFESYRALGERIGDACLADRRWTL